MPPEETAAGEAPHAVDDDWRYGIRLALRLSTAHHPLCTVFQSDRYRIGRVQVCRGCAAAVPTFILGTLAAFFLLGHEPDFAILLGATGLALGIPHATTYLQRFPPAYRAFAKLTGGIGLGLLIPAILFAPFPLALRVTVLALLGASFLGLQIVRMKKMLATCDACPWQRDWVHCPGFKA